MKTAVDVAHAITHATKTAQDAIDREADDTTELAWLGLSGDLVDLIDLIHDPVWTDDE